MGERKCSKSHAARTCMRVFSRFTLGAKQDVWFVDDAALYRA
jgi:hypothetical protein